MTGPDDGAGWQSGVSDTAKDWPLQAGGTGVVLTRAPFGSALATT